MTSAIKIYEYEKIECDVTAFWKIKNRKKKQRSTNSMKLTDYCHSDEKDKELHVGEEGVNEFPPGSIVWARTRSWYASKVLGLVYLPAEFKKGPLARDI